MLTATYTLVALSVEQAKVRTSLQSLQDLLHANLVHQSALTAGQISYAVDTVKRLYDSYVRRGANLNAEQKQQLSAYNQQLAELFATFSERVLADESTYITAAAAEAGGIDERRT